MKTDPNGVGNQCGKWRAKSDYDCVGYQSGIICSRLGRRVVGNYCGNVFMSGNSRSTGCGGIWRSMLGRSSVDPAPGVSTDPKRRFLGAVALRDRGRKLYPGPGGRGVGTSEAEADPKPSGWSMDEYLIRPLNYNKF